MFHVLCKAVVHFHSCVNKHPFDTHLSLTVINYRVVGDWFIKQNQSYSTFSPAGGICRIITDSIFLVILQHEGVKSLFVTSLQFLITRFLPQDNL